MKTKRMFVVAMISAFYILMPFKMGEAAVEIGYGWSVNPNEAKAIEEAVAMLKKTVPNPKFIFLMNESAYEDAVIANHLREIVPDSKFFGYEVSYAVFTPEGIHRGEEGSLAILGIHSPDWQIGTAVIDMASTTTVDQIKENAQVAIHQAIQNAGRTKEDSPDLVLIAPTKLKEEVILEAIKEIFGKEVNVMGGTPGNPMVFTESAVADVGFGLALIYSDSKIGVGFHSGVRVNQKMSGVVTALGESKRILKEIDGRPAFDVYNEWSGGRFDDVDVANMKEPLEIWKIAGRTPLVKLYDIGEGKYGTNVMVPAKLNPNLSLTVGADLDIGDRVYYSLGAKSSYIKRAGTIVKHALVNGKIKKSELAGGIHAYCRGAAFGQLGKTVENLEVVVEETRKAMEGKPFIGGFTAGEQGTIRGHGGFHGNLSSSMTVFSSES